MASWNDNTARVLHTEDFEPEEKQKDSEKPELRVTGNKKKSKVSSFLSLKNIVMAGILLFSLCIMINYRISVNEVNDQINVIQSRMVSLQSEYGRMESALEPTQSLPVIAERAQTELGMERIDQNEVQYVNIYEEDTVEISIAEQPQGVSGMIEQISAFIANSFKKLFE